MPKWKKDAKELTVGVNYSDERRYESSIPLTVTKKLGKKDAIKFVINEDDNSVQLVQAHILQKWK